MNRRSLLFALAALSTLPATRAFADYADDIVEVLKREGYQSIKVMRTLLGRTRIVATASWGTREVIVNPRTGEVLRDIVVSASSSKDRKPGILSSSDSSDDDSDSSSSSSSSSGNDDRDEKDESDDEDGGENDEDDKEDSHDDD